MDWGTFWLYIDRLSIIIGILIAIPVLWTWWQLVFGEHRQRRRWLAEISRDPGRRPGVLIIDLLPGRDILAQVKNHLAADAGLKDVSEDRIQRIQRNVPLQPAGVVAFAEELRAAARRLYDAGVDVIHCFHAGPDVTALITGAELSNGPRVLLYHYEQGAYRLFGPLEPLRDPGT